MAATPRFTRLLGTGSPVANPRLTKLVGSTGGTVGAKFTKLTGVTAPSARVRLVTLVANTILAAGAPSVTPPAEQDVVSGALVQLSASVTLHSPATSVTTWTWRLVGRDSGAKLPVFLSTSTPAIAVYVPVDSVLRNYTIGVTARDDAGRTSPEGTVLLVVQAADYLAAAAAGWTEPVENSFADASGWV